MLYVIVNPTAGGGRAGDILGTVTKLLTEHDKKHRVLRTSHPGHAAELAAQAVQEGASGIVCVGGDGTLNETVSGLDGNHLRLFVVPCGTGNDFVKALDLPKEPIEAFRKQLTGKDTLVDIGRANDRCFANVAGTGFDVEVLRRTVKFKRFGKGLLPYLLGVISALRHFDPMEVELTMEGKTETHSMTILSIGNGQYFGGGMKVTPYANPTDGLFDVIWVEAVSKFTIFRLLPKFISGAHTELPIAHCTRCSVLRIRSKGMTVNLDGELHDMDECSFRIIPGAVTMQL